MVNILVGIHAGLGEIALLGLLWIIAELMNPSDSHIRRARKVSMVVAIFIFMSWFAGGTYYVAHYGPEVKPIIKAGPQPWAHKIFTETKEHVFLFLPSLTIFLWVLLNQYGMKMKTNKKLRMAAITLAAVIFLTTMSMIGMGYIISAGARAALEVGAL